MRFFSSKPRTPKKISQAPTEHKLCWTIIEVWKKYPYHLIGLSHLWEIEEKDRHSLKGVNGVTYPKYSEVYQVTYRGSRILSFWIAEKIVPHSVKESFTLVFDLTNLEVGTKPMTEEEKMAFKNLYLLCEVALAEEEKKHRDKQELIRELRESWERDSFIDYSKR